MPKSLLTLLVALSLSSPLLASPPREMAVRATAYNSLPGQGMGNPSIGAWGDHVQGDMTFDVQPCKVGGDLTFKPRPSTDRSILFRLDLTLVSGTGGKALQLIAPR